MLNSARILRKYWENTWKSLWKQFEKYLGSLTVEFCMDSQILCSLWTLQQSSSPGHQVGTKQLDPDVEPPHVISVVLVGIEVTIKRVQMVSTLKTVLKRNICLVNVLLIFYFSGFLRSRFPNKNANLGIHSSVNFRDSLYFFSN